MLIPLNHQMYISSPNTSKLQGTEVQWASMDCCKHLSFLYARLRSMNWKSKLQRSLSMHQRAVGTSFWTHGVPLLFLGNFIISSKIVLGYVFFHLLSWVEVSLKGFEVDVCMGTEETLCVSGGTFALLAVQPICTIISYVMSTSIRWSWMARVDYKVDQFLFFIWFDPIMMRYVLLENIQRDRDMPFLFLMKSSVLAPSTLWPVNCELCIVPWKDTD